MGQILMNATTLLGGVFGLLIGVAILFMVVVILGLPYILMARRPDKHLRYGQNYDEDVDHHYANLDRGPSKL